MNRGSAKLKALPQLMLILVTMMQAQAECFQEQYAMDKSFAEEISFANVSDVTINVKQQHVLILQRSYPPVTVWSTNGTLLFAWSRQDISSPHSITLNGSNPASATVWITDMYDHCIKEFTYYGQYLQSIGKCGQYTNGSSLNPPQFDRVTDIAFNSKGYRYVTDGDVGGLNNRVLVFDQNNQLVDVWNKENKPAAGPLQFNLPHSVLIDRCDRVWIIDTKNYRIQILDENGTFLGQWKCFRKSLIYGIDFGYYKHNTFVILTAMTTSGIPEILFIPFYTNSCGELKNFGTCVIKRRLVPKREYSANTVAMPMLHAVAFNNNDGALYLAELPGSISPLKFHTVPTPPVSNMKECSGLTSPPPWQPQWTATALLTPFHASDLQTAEVQYSAKLGAMYIALQSTDGIKEYLTVGNDTFVLHKRSCLGPYNFGWRTPHREWLASHNCECKGSLEISGVQRKAWRCPIYETIDWYWFNENNNTWRMFFSNQTNPNHLPLLGEYALVHFATYGTDIETLQTTFNTCVKAAKRKEIHYSHTKQKFPSFVKGFSAGCSEMTHLPNWPQRLHMTVTMIPVLPGLENPLPTSVVYDWQRQSQRTTMCESSLVYNAYLIVNNTYITKQEISNGTVKCLSDSKYGPVRPNWMTLDNCKCMGTITDNYALSPWHFTAIATCPLMGDRVFWTWFTNDTDFSPLLFAETLTPPDEGTGLSLADYHKFYANDVLIDLLDFEVPSKCLHDKNYY